MHPITDADIEKLYEEEYGEYPYGYLLNGFREHADRITAVMKLVHSLQVESILDVGCNRGLFGALCNWSYRPLRRLVGVDISPTALQAASQVHGYDECRQLNASRPFRLEEMFDLVLCMELLEHVESVEVLIQNCFAHSRRYVLFSTPEEDGPIDGVIHVRHLDMDALATAVEKYGSKAKLTTKFVRSAFCEKPKWMGWNLVLAEIAA